MNVFYQMPHLLKLLRGNPAFQQKKIIQNLDYEFILFYSDYFFTKKQKLNL